MFERLLKLYYMAMANDVRSPMPHLFGPPGCGKSTVVEQLADLLKVKLRIVNVSRISPLEIEGVQMPHGMDGAEPRLLQLLATYWADLDDGDIILFDELLRGFPEVYNGLLDILTSRQVGHHKLPKLFIIGASNSTVAYDKALEDRLLHIPVPDIRKDQKARLDTEQILVDALGLNPDLRGTLELANLITTEVLPMYEILDQMGKGSAGAVLKGRSIRNLIGQAQLRDIESAALKDLLTYNNRISVAEGKYQYLFLFNKKNPEMTDPKTKDRLGQLVGNKRLTEIQATNLDLNLQLIGMEEKRRTKEVNDDVISDDDLFE